MASAMVEHVSPLGPVTTTVAPGSAVPVTVGTLLLVNEPSAGAITTGAPGAVLSKMKAAIDVAVLPAASEVVAVSSPVTPPGPAVPLQITVPPASAPHM